MTELSFRIRETALFPPQSRRRGRARRITFFCESVEQTTLIGEVDDRGLVVPRKEVFEVSFSTRGPVIEGFQDNTLGEFVRAQLEAFAKRGKPPTSCFISGLDPFLDTFESEEMTGRLRDLISVCEFRQNEFSPESAVRFLKDTGFFDDYVIVGVKYGQGWRRSRCITTFEGRPGAAAAILGHLSDYFQGEERKSDASGPRDEDGLL